MDAIFKALNDPARRALLDSLRRKDGQTLSDLEQQIEMSRFGVMKHLKVLEEARLVTTKKVGRFKYHYLNPLPLQEVIDRWINPFLKPQAEMLSALKSRLETEMKPDLVMSTFIDCTQDALWEALTRGDLMAQYHFACGKVSGHHQKPGDLLEMHFDDPERGVMLSNKLIAIEPKTRLEMSFAPGWAEDAAVSRCVYLIEPQDSGMKLTVEHYELSENMEGVNDGWARFLAGIKTWLETGRTHRFAQQTAG
ncbi:ArsR/SmtB family transcription factor [Antarctobacter jejuensis]|uniref:ArsR/SmtB family transcription factor n=1 Tax=Antarctobacter jejuensis TaxID=1439938 RepID=UPI003FD682D0